MQTSKEKSKTPESTEAKGTQVNPKQASADLDPKAQQKNKETIHNDLKEQKSRPVPGKEEEPDEEENEELEDENSPHAELDQTGSEKKASDPSRARNPNSREL